MSSIKIEGLDDLEIENTPVDELETEEVNLMYIAIDTSGSMTSFIPVMKNELEMFKKSIINSKESEKILVARIDFSSSVNFGGYKKIEKFDTDYQTSGGTRLFDAIVEGAKKLRDYISFLKQQGMRVKAVLAAFTDGEDNESKNSLINAQKTIQELNKAEFVTAFIAFGSEGLQMGKDLDFKNILEVGRSESELRKAFNQLSKSLISQSKSAVPKKTDFFEM